MLNKRVLYTISLLALLNFVVGCANNIPAQEISDARQALDSAKLMAKTRQDLTDLNVATELLNNAEKKLENQRYDLARPLVRESKEKSQDILKRYHVENKSNIRFDEY